MIAYPAKVLLFGEHIVMRGANALAAPLPLYGGQWAFTGEEASSKQMQLRAWSEHLAALRPGVDIDVDRFQLDLDAGLYFDSNIPTGYGLGSSGALCAAVYDRYAHENIRPQETSRLPELRRIFAAMESFFHGSSSGADPLICYLACPVLLHPDGGIDTVQLPPLQETGLTLFLLDSGRSRQTGPLVQYFRERCADPAFDSLMRGELLAPSDAAIHAWLEGRYHDFRNHFFSISEFQIGHLAPMIPEELHGHWATGLHSRQFALKLCGAGGGGVFLGLSEDWAGTTETLQRWALHALDE